MVFWPVILTGAVPALLSVLAVWPLALLYGDYKVMLYAIVVQALMTAVISHLVSQRPYRLVLDRAVMTQSLRFGWPLLVNGVLLFGVFNGDKLIVGRELGMATLAIFSMGFTLTLTPTLVMAKSVANFFLPQLSQIDRSTPEGEARFVHLAITTFEVHFTFGLFLVLGTMILGDPVVRILLGEKYASLIPLMTWLSIMQAIRVFKGGPSCVALAEGKSENAMISNLVRVGSLPLAWWAMTQDGGVLIVIWIAIAGEIVGFFVAVALARWRVSLPVKALTKPVILSFVMLTFTGIQTSLINEGQFGASYTVAAGAVFFFVIAVVHMTDLRAYISRR
jgi:O-antigen/teichoic acid export membrane protein